MKICRPNSSTHYYSVTKPDRVQMWSFATKIFCLPEANNEIIILGYREFSYHIILGNESETDNTKYFTNIGTLTLDLL